MCEWIKDTQFACSYDTIDDWENAVKALDDPETYASYSKKAYDRTYEMDVFSDITTVERKLIDYANTYPPPAELNGKAQIMAKQQPGASLQIRMPVAAGSGLPFRGGRFAVRR
jgi:hypothetical protein